MATSKTPIEHFFSEAAIKDAPQKRVFLKIKDNSITSSKLANKSVTVDKLAMGVGTPYGLATLDSNGNVPLSQLGNVDKGGDTPVVSPLIEEIQMDESGSNIDALNKVSPGKPIIYSILSYNTDTKKVNNIGVLMLVGDYYASTVTQILTWRVQEKTATYHRTYNISNTIITQPIGTWSDWELYTNNITSLSTTDIEKAWNNN